MKHDPADEPCVLERLEAVLQPIMWRNDKVSVGNELKLPPRSLDVSCPSVCALINLSASVRDAQCQIWVGGVGDNLHGSQRIFSAWRRGCRCTLGRANGCSMAKCKMQPSPSARLWLSIRSRAALRLPDLPTMMAHPLHVSCGFSLTQTLHVKCCKARLVTLRHYVWAVNLQDLLIC